VIDKVNRAPRCYRGGRTLYSPQCYEIVKFADIYVMSKTIGVLPEDHQITYDLRQAYLLTSRDEDRTGYTPWGGGGALQVR